MIFIGITGGVGAGKSAILEYLSKQPGCKVMLADEIAHQLMEPGTECYRQLKETFEGEDIWQQDGRFDRLALARVIFSDNKKRDILNSNVHPAVKKYVIDEKEKAIRENTISVLVLEAALLIEEHYDEICDELWYINTSRENRRKRLKIQRGYSDEKIDNIFSSQLTDEQYKENCKVIIDNNGTIEESILQIQKAFEQYKE